MEAIHFDRHWLPVGLPVESGQESWMLTRSAAITNCLQSVSGLAGLGFEFQTYPHEAINRVKHARSSG